MRLVHFTLKEYLSAHPDIFSSPHATIAEICLTYLNSQQVKDLLEKYYSMPDPDGLDLDEFDPDVFDPLLLFSILGCPCKEGTLGLRKITCPGDASGV